MQLFPHSAMAASHDDSQVCFVNSRAAHKTPRGTICRCPVIKKAEGRGWMKCVACGCLFGDRSIMPIAQLHAHFDIVTRGSAAEMTAPNVCANVIKFLSFARSSLGLTTLDTVMSYVQNAHASGTLVVLFIEKDDMAAAASKPARAVSVTAAAQSFRDVGSACDPKWF
jgi:hypothetical protein